MGNKGEALQLERIDHLELQLTDERYARLEKEAEIAMRTLRQTLPEELRDAREAHMARVRQIEQEYRLCLGDELDVKSGKLERGDRTITKLHPSP